MGIFQWLFGWGKQPESTVETVTVTHPEGKPKPEQKPKAPPKPETSERTFRIDKTTLQTEAVLRLAKESPDWNMSIAQILKRNFPDVNRYYWDIQQTELVPVPATEDSPAAVKVIMDGEYIGQLRGGKVTEACNLIRRGQILKITASIKGGPYKTLIDQTDDGEYTSRRASDYEIDEDESAYSAQIVILKKN